MEISSAAFGPTKDKRIKPDLAAVGCGTRSAARNPLRDQPHPMRYEHGRAQCGCRRGAGAAVLRGGWYPTGQKGSGRTFVPSGALLKAVLLNSTVDMTAQPGYPSDFEGWGLIQLERTLYFKGDARTLLVWDVNHDVGLVRRETKRHDLIVGTAGEQLKITLVWTDPRPRRSPSTSRRSTTSTWL